MGGVEFVVTTTVSHIINFNYKNQKKTTLFKRLLWETDIPVAPNKQQQNLRQDFMKHSATTQLIDTHTQALNKLNQKMHDLQYRAQKLELARTADPELQKQMTHIYDAIAETLKSQAEMEKRLVDLKYQTRLQSIKQPAHLRETITPERVDRINSVQVTGIVPTSSSHKSGQFRHSLLNKQNTGAKTGVKEFSTTSKNNTEGKPVATHRIYETTPFQKLKDTRFNNNSGHDTVTKERTASASQFKLYNQNHTFGVVQAPALAHELDYKPVHVHFPQFLNSSKDSVALVEQYIRGDKARQFEYILQECRKHGQDTSLDKQSLLMKYQQYLNKKSHQYLSNGSQIQDSELKKEYASPVDILSTKHQHAYNNSGDKQFRLHPEMVTASYNKNSIDQGQPRESKHTNKKNRNSQGAGGAPKANLDTFIKNNYNLKISESKSQISPDAENLYPNPSHSYFKANNSANIQNNSGQFAKGPETVKRKIAYDEPISQDSILEETETKYSTRKMHSRSKVGPSSAARLSYLKHNSSKTKYELSSYKHRADDSMCSDASSSKKKSTPKELQSAMSRATQKIRNRLQQSWALYEDSTFKNTKHEREHLLNTFAKENKFRQEIMGKIVEQTRRAKHEW